MAGIAIKNTKLLQGVVVSAFPTESAWPFVDKNQVPPYTATEQQTVDSAGAATFSALTAGKSYWLSGTSESQLHFVFVVAA